MEIKRHHNGASPGQYRRPRAEAMEIKGRPIQGYVRFARGRYVQQEVLQRVQQADRAGCSRLTEQREEQKDKVREPFTEGQEKTKSQEHHQK